MKLRALLLVQLLVVLGAHAQTDVSTSNIDVDSISVQGFVRRCGGVQRQLAPTPPVRPFESLAHLAPLSREVIYAETVGGSSSVDFFVLDGVVELAPDWTHRYPPIVTPTGESHRLHFYPEELP
jgi:hypothetical protein